jgi:hypothetical protein
MCNPQSVSSLLFAVVRHLMHVFCVVRSGEALGSYVSLFLQVVLRQPSIAFFACLAGSIDEPISYGEVLLHGEQTCVLGDAMHPTSLVMT